MLSNILSSPLTTFLKSVHGRVVRWAYSFDGVDDHAQLAFRAINPDGDNTFEFWSPPDIGRVSVILSQNISGNFASREFQITSNATGTLSVNLGGAGSTVLTVAQGYKASTKYGLALIGSKAIVYNGGLTGTLLNTAAFTRGAAREPTALTKIGSNSDGVSHFNFFQGIQRDVKINGVLYPMADRNQPIQLSSPSGLGTELATPEVIATPYFKGSQWTYLGDGRWQYVGDGTYNELILINSALQPQAGFVEFEVESISGVMRTYAATSKVGVHQSSPVFTTTGKFRHFVTSRSGVASGTYFSFVRSNTGQAASCIIKNISFKPLISAYGEELIRNGGFSSATGWSVGAGATITNNELQINYATVVGASQSIPTVNGRLYEVTFSVKSISSGSVRMILYGNGMQYVGPNRNAVGTYTELVMFNATGGSSNNAITIQGGNVSSTVAVVDDVSVREVVSYCNPMTLSNTTSDRWTEIEE